MGHGSRTHHPWSRWIWRGTCILSPLSRCGSRPLWKYKSKSRCRWQDQTHCAGSHFLWLPAKISGRCLSISRDGLARAGTWLCRGARSSAGGPPVRTHHGGQLRCRNLAVGWRGGLERWATHLSQTGVFRGPDRPNIVETIGVSVTKAEQRLLALSTCQCSHFDEGGGHLRGAFC